MGEQKTYEVSDFFGEVKNFEVSDQPEIRRYDYSIIVTHWRKDKLKVNYTNNSVAYIPTYI